MEIIKGTHVEAFDYLDKIDPKLWSRHAISTHSCSDILLNNIMEIFNAWILQGREKLILSMMEMIR
jgi:hypothetical protein